MADGTMTPASVKLSIGGKNIDITDASLNLVLTNGSEYVAGGTKKGSAGYMLNTAPRVKQLSEIYVTTTNTTDGKNKESIDALRALFKKTQDETDPGKYAEPINFVISNSAGKILVTIDFTGCVHDFEDKEPDGVLPPQQEAKILVTDPLTLKFS